MTTTKLSQNKLHSQSMLNTECFWGREPHPRVSLSHAHGIINSWNPNCCRSVAVAVTTKANATSHCSTLAAHSADPTGSSNSRPWLPGALEAPHASFCGDAHSWSLSPGQTWWTLQQSITHRWSKFGYKRFSSSDDIFRTKPEYTDRWMEGQTLQTWWFQHTPQNTENVCVGGRGGGLKSGPEFLLKSILHFSEPLLAESTNTEGKCILLIKCQTYSIIAKGTTEAWTIYNS